MSLLSTNQNGLLSSSMTIYPDTTTIVRNTTTNDGTGGVTRTVQSTLFTNIPAKVEEPDASIIEQYGRQGTLIDTVIYTTTNIMTTRLNDIAAISGKTYVVKFPQDMGGMHRNFAIYCQVKP